MFFYWFKIRTQCSMFHAQLLNLLSWSTLMLKANKKQLKVLSNSFLHCFFRNERQRLLKSCWKCKFKLTINLYNQLASFFHFAKQFSVHCLLTFANTAKIIKFSIHFASQSTAYLSALCLLTWKILWTNFSLMFCNCNQGTPIITPHLLPTTALQQKSWFLKEESARHVFNKWI